MFGLSMTHILIILIVLLLFGNRRLPELGESLGKGLRNFKRALDGRDEMLTKKDEPAAEPRSTDSEKKS